jgi:twitching motility protein PilT
MEPDEEAALLGRIAVKYNFITLEQLAEATRERGRLGKKLGVIMLEKGMIDEFTLGKILALQQRHQASLERQRQEHARPRPERRKMPTPRDWVAQTTDESLPLPPPRRRARLGHPAGDAVARTERAPIERPLGRAALPRSEQVTPVVGPRGIAGAATAPDHDRPPAPRDAAFRGLSPPASPDLPASTAAAPRRGNRFTDPLAGIGIDEGSSVARMTAPSMGVIDASRDTAPSMRRFLERASEHDERATEAPRDTIIDFADRKSTLRSDDDETIPPSASSHGPATTTPPGPSERPPLEPRPGPRARPSPYVEHLHAILAHAADARASDVIVSPGNVVRMRLMGRVVPLTDAPLAPEATEHVLREILTPWQLGRLDDAGEVDLAYAIPGVGRFRTNVFRQLAGLSAAFHHVPDRVPTLTQLNLPAALAKLTNYAQGLILLTGPAGCGKTSTLAALINILNEERRDHILTIEDPIEYVHESKRCIVNQRQVGRHTTSFARALRGALREDPDIICIGELRDLETISLALSAAETGHLVLATLHTGSAVGTITRIVGSFPPSQQSQIRAMMSESLRAVISQRLLPTVDESEVVPALEILYVTKAVGALIRDNRTFQLRSILQTGRAHGMQLLDVALRELVESGKVSPDVAHAHCEDPRVIGGVA